VRVVFMGSPEFAVPSLRRLLADHEVVGVVTQPDRPAGRGRTPRPPPVKTVALEAGVPFMQPPRLRDAGAVETLRHWAPDLILVAAYGQILRPEVLAIPRHGCLNVHASLLPRWRGAAPVQAAILYGDDVTGVTVMQMDPGMDTGPIVAQKDLPIQPDDTGATLSARLATAGAELLQTTLPVYATGSLQPQPQNEAQVTYAPLLMKSDGALDLQRSAAYLARQVRAFEPWPGSYLEWEGARLVIRRAHAEGREPQEIGRVSLTDGLPSVGTGAGQLVLDALQPAGRKEIRGDDFLRGARGFLGALLPSLGHHPSEAPPGPGGPRT
jgi:methionyl-tRNA formyltransferase